MSFISTVCSSLFDGHLSVEWLLFWLTIKRGCWAINKWLSAIFCKLKIEHWLKQSRNRRKRVFSHKNKSTLCCVIFSTFFLKDQTQSLSNCSLRNCIQFLELDFFFKSTFIFWMSLLNSQTLCTTHVQQCRRHDVEGSCWSWLLQNCTRRPHC